MHVERERSRRLAGCAAYLLPVAVVAVASSAVGRLWGSERVFPQYGDLVRHFGVYFTLGAFVSGFTCLLRGEARGATVLWGVLVVSFYGIVQELRQALPDRSIEWGDAAMNIGGAVAGATVIGLLGLLWRRRRGISTRYRT